MDGRPFRAGSREGVMVRIVALMVRLPLDILATSMELMAHAIRELQDNLDVPGRRPAALPAFPAPPSYPYVAPSVPPPAGRREPIPVGTDPGPRPDVTPAIPPAPKEVRPMPDRDLSGDDLKLVRYKVLFTKRNYEQAFPEQEELLYDDMDVSRFTAWKIAEFVQSLDDEPDPSRRITNKKFATYLMDKDGPDDGRGAAAASSSPPATGVGIGSAPATGGTGKGDNRNKKYQYITVDDDRYFLADLPHEDKKYLRLFYEALDRFPREEFKHEERQIEVLEEISQNLKKKR